MATRAGAEGGAVTMRSWIRVRDLATDKSDIYTLVYPAEAAIHRGKLSVSARLSQHCYACAYARRSRCGKDHRLARCYQRCGRQTKTVSVERPRRLPRLRHRA